MLLTLMRIISFEKRPVRMPDNNSCLKMLEFVIVALLAIISTTIIYASWIYESYDSIFIVSFLYDVYKDEILNSKNVL